MSPRPWPGRAACASSDARQLAGSARSAGSGWASSLRSREAGAQGGGGTSASAAVQPSACRAAPAREQRWGGGQPRAPLAQRGKALLRLVHRAVVLQLAERGGEIVRHVRQLGRAEQRHGTGERQRARQRAQQQPALLAALPAGGVDDLQGRGAAGEDPTSLSGACQALEWPMLMHGLHGAAPLAAGAAQRSACARLRARAQRVGAGALQCWRQLSIIQRHVIGVHVSSIRVLVLLGLTSGRGAGGRRQVGVEQQAAPQALYCAVFPQSATRPCKLARCAGPPTCGLLSTGSVSSATA